MPDLTDEQRRCLHHVYEHFHAESTWPIVSKLQHRLVVELKERIRLGDVLETMPRGLSNFNGLEGEVWLTTRGIRATEGPIAQELEDFVQFVLLSVRMYEANPDAEIRRSDLVATGLSDDRAKRVHLLSQHEPNLWRGGGATLGGDWHWLVSHDIWQFDGIRSIEEYFERDEHLRNPEPRRPFPGTLTVPIEDPDVALAAADETARREPEFAPVDFEEVVDEPELALLLGERWREIGVCIASGAALAAVILMGGVLEGALLSTARSHPEAANRSSLTPRDQRGRVRPTSDWTLSQLIDVGRDCGWLHTGSSRFTDVLRDYRNFIHPAAQLRAKTQIDDGTAAICVAVVRKALADIVASRHR